jgi:hypothetical protein
VPSFGINSLGTDHCNTVWFWTPEIFLLTDSRARSGAVVSGDGERKPCVADGIIKVLFFSNFWVEVISPRWLNLQTIVPLAVQS